MHERGREKSVKEADGGKTNQAFSTKGLAIERERMNSDLQELTRL
jgi:hypothetical protein